LREPVSKPAFGGQVGSGLAGRCHTCPPHASTTLLCEVQCPPRSENHRWGTNRLKLEIAAKSDLVRTEIQALNGLLE
jgi:hypothetical protein